ncbi:MAG: hypothetical protein R3E86_01870 [Pseudomonadales bacterium]
MMLPPGEWLGKGSLLAAGRSLGRAIACSVLVERDDNGTTLKGSWHDDPDLPRDFVLRIAANESGTYTLSMRLAGDTLQGTAKLDSAPNLALLWNDSSTVHVAAALFALGDGGLGLRGFVRDGDAVLTWELRFTRRQQTLGGDNVVTLRRRR